MRMLGMQRRALLTRRSITLLLGVTLLLGMVAFTAPPGQAQTPPSGLLWTADHESGNTREWDGASISGRAEVQVVSSPTHSGRYALKLINWDVDGSHSPGVRMKVQKLLPDPKNLPDDAYYSVWYYIPFPIEGRDNIFQFKQADVTKWNPDGSPKSQTRRMLSKVSMNWDGSAFDLEYRTRIDQSTGRWRQGEAISLASVNTNIPVGRWFHLEMRYVWGQNGTGRSTLWLDGRQIWDLRNISTEANNTTYKQEPRQWAVNHYLADGQGYVAPGDSWIFIDDAKIATYRVGPSGGGGNPPSDDPPQPPRTCDGTFCDDDSSIFEAEIEKLAAAGITKGCNPPYNDEFCPKEPVTRETMAAFIVRAMNLKDRGSIRFVDDNDSIFEQDIEKLATAGITVGCNPPYNTRYCPKTPVTREMMAGFLSRALNLTRQGGIDFVDDNNSLFEDDIERIAYVGITRGCNPPTNDRYCPGNVVTRETMAAFLVRAFDL